MSLPPRDYGMAAGLLAEVVDAARRRGATSNASRAATGASIGAVGVRRRRGGAARGRATSRTARRRRPAPAQLPFHALARDFPPVVCGMNLALLEGVLDGLGETGLSARMDPRPGECCVALVSKNNEH